jgi:hypothetical protein
VASGQWLSKNEKRGACGTDGRPSVQAPEFGANIGYKEKERGVRAALFFYSLFLVWQVRREIVP